MWKPFLGKSKQQEEEEDTFYNNIEEEEHHELYDFLYEEIDKAGPENVLRGLLRACKDWWGQHERTPTGSQGRLVCLTIAQAIAMIRTINNERYKQDLTLAEVANLPIDDKHLKRLIDEDWDQMLGEL